MDGRERASPPPAIGNSPLFFIPNYPYDDDHNNLCAQTIRDTRLYLFNFNFDLLLGARAETKTGGSGVCR